MYVLALYGSPRQQGNTDILLDKFLKGALQPPSSPLTKGERGLLQIEKVFIRDLKISPCSCKTMMLLHPVRVAVGKHIKTMQRVKKQAVDASNGASREYNVCLKTGECIIKDEMTVLYDKLLKADLVVLSAPIFFYNVPAQVKIIIDRCQALWARKYILKNMPKNQNRKGFFISVGGTKGEDLFTGATLTVRYFFKAINVDYAGDIFYKNIDTKGVIKEYPSALKEVFEAGKNLVTEFQK